MSDKVSRNDDEVSPKTVMFSLPGNDGTTGTTQKGGKEHDGTLFPNVISSYAEVARFGSRERPPGLMARLPLDSLSTPSPPVPRLPVLKLKFGIYSPISCGHLS